MATEEDQSEAEHKHLFQSWMGRLRASRAFCGPFDGRPFGILCYFRVGICPRPPPPGQKLLGFLLTMWWLAFRVKPGISDLMA